VSWGVHHKRGRKPTGQNRYRDGERFGFPARPFICISRHIQLPGLAELKFSTTSALSKEDRQPKLPDTKDPSAFK
jgi:hypothetical protein